MMLTLAPLPRDAVAEVAHLQLPPAQRGFVGLIEEMTAEPDLLQDFHIVRHATETVGFFKIDQDFSRTDPRLTPGTHGLRGLLIGGQYQRRGLGTALLEQLPSYLAKTYPDQTGITLRVDDSNQPAIRAYLASGWQLSTMAPFAGRTGPELTLTLRLRGPHA